MQKLIVPLPEIKRYAKSLGKAPYNNQWFRYTQFMDAVVMGLGHEDLRAYKAHARDKNHACANYTSIDELSLYDLSQWQNRLEKTLSDSGIQSNPEYSLFDKYTSYQIDHVMDLPALRISGLLYLISLLAQKPLYDTERYRLNDEAFLSYLKLKGLNPELELRLIQYSEKNRTTGTRYHEGRFLEIFDRWSEDHISDERFLAEIRSLLSEEIEYMEGVTNQKSVKFSFPAASRMSGSSNATFLKNVRNAVTVNAPLLLGFEKKEPGKSGLLSFKQNEKPLLLTNAQIKENILISGVGGSGRIRLGLGLISQAIMAGKGCLYLDGRGDPSLYWLINAMAKSVGRQDDVVFLTLQHDSTFDALHLRRLMASNKIVVLWLPASEKDPKALQSMYKQCFQTLNRSLSALKPMSQYFPYLLALSDIVSSLRQNDLEDYLTMIRNANKAKLAVVGMEQSLSDVDESIKGSRSPFGHKIIMKQIDLLRVSDQQLKTTVAHLDMGEFVYQQSGQSQPEPIIYKAPYSDPCLESNYLIMC